MAKAFEFRLEKLLELRRLQEDAATRELAEARQAVAVRNQVILGLLSEEDRAKGDLRDLQRRAIDVRLLRSASEFVGSLERLLRREYETLQELVKLEIEKRARLTEARKGVRVLERFRDRKLGLHRRESDLEEQRFLDEIGRNVAKGA